MLIGGHHGHRVIAQWIIGIFIHHDENPCRTSNSTIAAAIALVGIDRYKEIT